VRLAIGSKEEMMLLKDRGVTGQVLTVPEANLCQS
jgi:hypothetical protein